LSFPRISLIFKKSFAVGESSMKKIFAAFFITLLGSMFAFSQADTKSTADWRTFAPEGEEFSVETPAALNASIFQQPKTGNLTSRRYLNLFDGTYYFVFSDSPKNGWYLETVRKFVKNYASTGTTQRVGDFEGEKFVFTDKEDFYHTVLIVDGKNRKYAFQTVSPTKDNAAVERFFSSLKLEAKTLEPAEQKEEETINLTISPENKPVIPGGGAVSGGGQGSGYGIGNGNGNGTGGNGIGNGRGNQTTPESKPTNITAGVKILSKPRANYTDFARFYEIKGKVVLRVTFSANGTVGAVAVVSKLPFGLSEQAIAAARGITFEPAIKEGIPYSVTKPVEYTFIIY